MLQPDRPVILAIAHVEDPESYPAVTPSTNFEMIRGPGD